MVGKFGLETRNEKWSNGTQQTTKYLSIPSLKNIQDIYGQWEPLDERRRTKLSIKLHNYK